MSRMGLNECYSLYSTKKPQIYIDNIHIFLRSWTFLHLWVLQVAKIVQTYRLSFSDLILLFKAVAVIPFFCFLLFHTTAYSNLIPLFLQSLIISFLLFEEYKNTIKLRQDILDFCSYTAWDSDVMSDYCVLHFKNITQRKTYKHARLVLQYY